MILMLCFDHEGRSTGLLLRMPWHHTMFHVLVLLAHHFS